MSRHFLKRIAWLATCTCGLLCTSVPACAAESEDFASLFERLSPSVWTVIVDTARGKSQGSAVVIGDGALVTNCHVLKDGISVVIYNQNRRYKAALKYPDAARDLCILHVEDFHQPVVMIAPLDSLRVGQRVIAIGSPEGLANTLSDGLVSAVIHDLDGSIQAIQTSAPISHGSSGGGLFDGQGRLIGITASNLDRGQAQNLNFAVPASWIANVPARSRLQLAEKQGPTTKADEPVPPSTQPYRPWNAPGFTLPPPASIQPQPPGAIRPSEAPGPDAGFGTKPGGRPPSGDAAVSDQRRAYRTIEDTEILLSSHARWDGACRPRGVPDINVDRQPAHGHIEIRSGDFIIQTPSSSTPEACAGRSIYGLLVFYHPDAQFHGDDSARYTVSAPRYKYTREISVAVSDATGSASTVVDHEWFLAHCSNPSPNYPLDAMHSLMQGKVVLAIKVDGKGHAMLDSIRSSSGYKTLDNAAADAISKMTCPVDGVERHGTQHYTFALTQSHDPDSTASTTLPLPAEGKIYCSIAVPRQAAGLHQNEKTAASIGFDISSEGKIENVAIVESAGNEILDASALEAIKSSECRPYIQNGKPIRSHYVQPFIF